MRWAEHVELKARGEMHESDSCKTREIGIDGNIILTFIIKNQVPKMDWIVLF
jgi:hypothetical protein